jgi:hypothetical protein
MYFKKIVPFKIIFLIIFALASLASCQRGLHSVSPSSLPLLNSVLASKIPSDSPGFLIANSTEAQANYSARVQAVYEQVQTVMKDQPGGHDLSKLVVQDSFLQSLSKISATLLGSDGTGNILESVFFLSREPSGLLPLSFNIVYRLRQGVPSSELFFELTSALSDHQLDFSLQNIDGRESVVLNVGPEGLKVPLFISRHNDLIAFSTSRASLSRLLSPRSENQSTGLKEFFSQKEIKRLVKDLPFSKHDNFLMFLDFRGILETLNPYLNFLEMANSKAIKDFPISHALMRSEISGTAMSSSVAFDSADLIKNLSLEPRSKSSLISHVKNDAVFFFALDGSLLKMLLDQDKAGLPLPKTILKEIKTLRAAGIGISRNSRVFPDLFALFQLGHKKKDTLDLLRSELNAGLRGSGLPLSSWQEREINGIQVHSMQSPLGIGAFFSQDSDHLFLTTSEMSLRALYDKKKPSLSTKINSNQQSSLALLFLDFNEMGSLISSIEGWINMFSGGTGAADDLLSNALVLKEMGNIYFSVAADKGIVRVDTRHSFE